MADAKAGAGAAPGPGPKPVPAPLPEKPLLGTSNNQVAVTGKSYTNIGVQGQSGSPGAAPVADGVLGVGQNGVHGQAYFSGGTGVLGEYMGPGMGDGVLGTGPNGLHGKSPAGVGGNGVLGENSSTGTGVTGTSHQGHGVHGTNGGGSGLAPQYGAGVWGESDFGYGVFGASKTNPGVQGVSSGFDGVHGESHSAQHAGVSGVNTSAGFGVYGYSDGNSGVVGKSSNFNGGWFESAQAEGVRGVSHNANHGGVVGVCMQANGIGVFGYCDDGTGTLVGTGVYGKSSQGGEAGHFEGNVTINGMLTHNGNCSVNGTLTVQNDVVLLAAGQDCAEQFELNEAEQLEPGTVVVIDRDGALRRSHAAYDKKVAGVISGAGPCRPGIVLGKRTSKAHFADVALVGRVYCKVEARHSSIAVGDLLVSSDTPGHAMRADDAQRAFGAVIGKSLGRLDGGQGLIPILVALQ